MSKEIQSDLIGLALSFEELSIIEEALSNQSHMYKAMLKGLPMPEKQRRAMALGLQVSLGLQKRALEILAEFEYIDDDNE